MFGGAKLTVAIILIVIITLLLFKEAMSYRSDIDREYLQQRVSESVYCSADEDCVVIGQPCNIVGCGIAVNKEEAPKISFILYNYNFPYNRVCDLKCPVARAECIKKKCTINNV